MSVTNDIRRAITIEIKEKHQQHTTVTRVSWGIAVFITLQYCAFYGVETDCFFVLAVHCERLQSLSNNKCCMNPDNVKYILV